MMQIHLWSHAKSLPRLKTLIAGLFVVTVTTVGIALFGNNDPSWWTNAPVAAAGIDASRSLITLENNLDSKSSLLIVRANLAKEVTEVRLLPAYFDTMAVNGSRAILAKRGVARSQCLNLVSGKLSEELEFPTEFKIIGTSAMNNDSFLIWGADSGRGTLIFQTNCTAMHAVATSQEQLELICPTRNRLVAIDFQGAIFLTKNGFEFEKTRQKFPKLDSLACGGAGMAGHFSSGSTDFILSINSESSKSNQLSRGRGLFALLFDNHGFEWFGLKHGKSPTTVGMFPIRE